MVGFKRMDPKLTPMHTSKGFFLSICLDVMLYWHFTGLEGELEILPFFHTSKFIARNILKINLMLKSL